MTDQPPTELARPVDATEASLAWSIDDSPEVAPYRPRWIARTAVAAALVLIAGAGAIAIHQLRPAPPHASVPVAESEPITTTVTTTRPTVMPTPTSQLVAPTQATVTRSQQRAPIVLPSRGGSVFVRTQSGKTVCQVTAGDVGCNVAFTRPVPVFDGLPASGVEVTSRGEWQWIIGDPGNPDYATIDYGATYDALGWTITPTSEGTTFMNDSTGHGMTVSVEGFQAF